MEYVNYLLTPTDESLRIANVLDNFEHAKCGKLLKSEVYVSLSKRTFLR